MVEESSTRLKLDKAIWDSTALNYLRKTTRQSKFDFEKVADSMKQYFLSKSYNQDQVSVTSEICRRVFAGDYYSESTPSSIRVQETIEIKGPSINDPNLSHDQIMQIIQQKEKETKRKQEYVFARVLSSLQGDVPQSVMVNETPETTQYLAQMEEQRLKKEREHNEFIERLKQQEEQEELRRQREALRRRFEENPVTSPGLSSSSSLPSTQESIDISPTSQQIHNRIFHEIDEIPDEAVSQFNMKEIFESSEFDQILTEIENDLNIKAPGKLDEDNYSLELLEIFRILDSGGNSQALINEFSQTSKKVSKVVQTTLLPPVPPVQPILDILRSQTDRRSKAAHEDAEEEVKSNSNRAMTVRDDRLVENMSRLHISTQPRSYMGIKETRRSDFVTSTFETDDEVHDSDDEDEWSKQRQKIKNSI